MSDHVSKISNDIATLRDEKFSELSVLRQNENKRHSDVSCSIQSRDGTELSNTVSTVTMSIAKKNAAKRIQELDITPIIQTTSTIYQPGNVDRYSSLCRHGYRK